MKSRRNKKKDTNQERNDNFIFETQRSTLQFNFSDQETPQKKTNKNLFDRCINYFSSQN